MEVNPVSLRRDAALIPLAGDKPGKLLFFAGISLHGRQLPTQTGEIGRQFRLEPKDFSARGMLDRQDMGMEGLSAKGLERNLGLLRQKHALGAKTRPIDLITQQGMPDRSQMHPNLVGAAGFEAAQEQAGDWLSWPLCFSPPPREARPPCHSARALPSG